jgi:hypothetical protein
MTCEHFFARATEYLAGGSIKLPAAMAVVLWEFNKRWREKKTSRIDGRQGRLPY